jgi:hypothetical protein
VGGSLVVEDDVGMKVLVNSGKAWFNGSWLNNDSDTLLALDAAELTLDRRDAIVVEINFTNRENTIKIVKGTPNVSPVAPTLTNTSLIHQYPLAHISVAHGTTEITAPMITNKVGTGDCPFITGILDTVDIDALLLQWDGEFTTWFEGIQDILTEEAAGNLLALINALDTRIDTLEDNMQYYAATATGNDTYAVTVPKFAYDIGKTIRFKTDVANTGACSLNVNGLGACNIRKVINTGLADLVTGDILSGVIYLLVYTGGSVFQLVNPLDYILRIIGGGARKALAMNSSNNDWEFIDTLQSLMTTKGDLLYASAANIASALAIGAQGTVLTVDAYGLPSWGTGLKASSGSYTGNGALKTIALSYRAYFVVIYNVANSRIHIGHYLSNNMGYHFASAAAVTHNATTTKAPLSVSNGFQVSGTNSDDLSYSGGTYYYMAIGV